MTPPEGRAAEKAFAMRRASLLPEDEAADQQLLDRLIVLERDAAGNPLPPRALTNGERALHLAGKLAHAVKGEIVRAEVAAAREAERMAAARALAGTRARRAEVEARRLTAEA